MANKIQYFLLKTIIVFCFNLSNSQLVYADYAVVVTSFDKHEELWQPFFTLMCRYWPNVKTKKIYLITNTKDYADTTLSVTTFKVPNEKSWSDNLIKLLNNIPEDDVLLILDDYFIDAPVQETLLAQYYADFNKLNAAILHLKPLRDHLLPITNFTNIANIAVDEPYRTSLQVALWQKKALLALLEPKENAWDFELYSVTRSSNIGGVYSVINPPINYLPVLWRGNWTPIAKDFLAKENIAVNYTLPERSRLMCFLLGEVRNWLSLHIVTPIKNFLGIKAMLPTGLG